MCVSPQRFFVLAATLLTLLYVSFVFPVTHYYHGTQRSLQMVHYAMGALGHPDQIPVSVIKVIKESTPNKLAWHYPKQARGWDVMLGHKYYYASTRGNAPKTESTLKRLHRLGTIPLQIDKTVPFETLGEPLSYPIIGFLPSIIPVFIALLLNSSPVWVLVWMMIGKAILSITMGYWIIRCTPILKWPTTLLLLMPTYALMRLFPMPDTLCIELAMLLTAYVLRIYQSCSLLSGFKLSGLVGLSVLVSLTKLAYFPVSAIFTILPKQCFQSHWKKWGFALLAMLVSMAASVIWLLYIRSSYTPSVYRATQGEGVQHIGLMFLYVKKVFFMFIGGLDNGEHIYSYVRGLFFWKGRVAQANMTYWYPWAGLVILLLTTIVPLYDEKTKVYLWPRCAGALVFIMMLYFSYFGTALNPGGWSNRVQARYILPVLPLLLLAIYDLPLFGQKKPSFLPAFFVVSGCIIWLAMHYVMLRIQHVI